MDESLEDGSVAGSIDGGSIDGGSIDGGSVGSDVDDAIDSGVDAPMSSMMTGGGGGGGIDSMESMPDDGSVGSVGDSDVGGVDSGIDSDVDDGSAMPDPVGSSVPSGSVSSVGPGAGAGVGANTGGGARPSAAGSRAAASSKSGRGAPPRSMSKRSLGSLGSPTSSVQLGSLREDKAALEARVLELEEQLAKNAVTEAQIKEMASRLERYELAREREREQTGAGSEYDRIAQLEEEVYQKGKELVDQSEKGYKLAERIRLMNERVQEKQATEDALRAALVSGIAGEDAEPDRYSNVSLMDLLRLRVNKVDTGENKVSFANTLARKQRGATSRTSTAASDSSRRHSSDSKRADDDAEERVPPGGVSKIMEAEREIKALRERNRRLYDKVQGLQEELQEANETISRMDDMRAQVHNFAERFRFEKDARARTEEEALAASEKIDALSDHIEKLMNHLKHEAAAKAKAYEMSRRSERELQMLRNRNAALAKRNAAREKVIVELKEGSRILEDQLRLMDEKYIDLRGKLDWTRAHSQKEVKKIQTQAERLRMKWMMAQSLGAIPEHLMDSPQELKQTTLGGK